MGTQLSSSLLTLHMKPRFPDSLLDSDSSDRKPRTSVGEKITLAEATDWTKTYQSNHPDQLKAVYFSADVFIDFLKQGGDGIRIYNATNDNGEDCFVLVSATTDSDLTAEQIYDKGFCCPNACVPSPLNHA
jgi:hypothetical protein